jgi:hypothetical protein
MSRLPMNTNGITLSLSAVTNLAKAARQPLDKYFLAELAYVLTQVADPDKLMYLHASLGSLRGYQSATIKLPRPQLYGPVVLARIRAIG